MAYNGSTYVGSGLVPRKNNDYPLIDAHHVQVGDTEAPEDRLDYVLAHGGGGGSGGDAASAAESAKKAAACATQALIGSQLSRSWAVGGTGLRADEDTNNAKYYAEQAAGGGGGGVPSSHLTDYNNPHQVTKTQVGLGNVDNTADAAKQFGAAQITGGTLGGSVLANATAQETLGTAMVRNIYIGTTDLTAGTSALPTGTIYFVYEV